MFAAAGFTHLTDTNGNPKRVYISEFYRKPGESVDAWQCPVSISGRLLDMIDDQNFDIGLS
jgi:hypothetical protein